MYKRLAHSSDASNYHQTTKKKMIDYYYCYLHNKDEGTWRSDSQ